jgi:hypothetical protein
MNGVSGQDQTRRWDSCAAEPDGPNKTRPTEVGIDPNRSLVLARKRGPDAISPTFVMGKQSQFPGRRVCARPMASGDAHSALLCETKPICARGPAWRAGTLTLPRQTKPIGGNRERPTGDRVEDCAERSQFGAEIILPNKPNCQGQRMKQSQFAIGRRGAKYWPWKELQQKLSERACGKQSQFTLAVSGGHSPPYRKAGRAKQSPLAGGRSCETKPIWPAGQWYPWHTLRKEPCAKQDAHDKSRRVGFWPAFPGRYRGSVRSIPTSVGRVKQSQFEGSFEFEVRSVKLGGNMSTGPTSHFTLLGSRFGGVFRARS